MHSYLTDFNKSNFDEKTTIEQLKKELDQARTTENMNKNLTPYYPPKKSNFDVLMFQTKAEYNNNIANEVNVKKTYTTNFKHSSLVNNLSSLKQIYIDQLMINKKNLGTYLICKSITDSFKLSAVMAMVEDEKGNIEDLSIYNYYHKDFDHLQYFPKGTVFYIKEPFLKLPMSGKGSLIRVDSPSDIIVDDYNLSGKFKLQIIHLSQLKTPSSPKWEDLKNLGNNHYSKKKYELAIRCYKIGICIKETAVLYSNLAISYLGLDYFFQAYKAGIRGLELLGGEESDIAIKLEEKLNFRIGKAFYGMRQWERASEYFRKCEELNTVDNKENRMEIKRCEQRLLEQKSGKYNFLNMFLDESKYDSDVADYGHSDLIVAQNEEKGHHIIANSFIPKNTILVVSKAFSYYKNSDNNNFIFSFNVQENKVDETSQYHAKSILLHNVYSNPFLAKEVYGLFSKNKFDRKEILSDEIVDVLRLETIADANFFGGEEMDKFGFMTPEEHQNQYKYDKNCGLWIFPSLFNHSCVSNCERHFFGDVMILISRRDLGKGEELTLNYVPFLDDYEKRKTIIEAHYGFICKCELCQTDRRDPYLQTRKKICDDFPKLKEKLTNSKKLEEILNKLIKTYENRPNFKFDLIIFSATLAQCYFMKMKFKKAGDLFMSITEILYEIDSHLFCLFCLKAAKTYRCGNLMELSDRAIKLAIENDVFKNSNLFKIRFKELFE